MRQLETIEKMYKEITSEVTMEQVEHCYYSREYPMLLLATKDNCELEDIILSALLVRWNCNVILTFTNMFDFVLINCISTNPCIRALEFMDYILDTDGMTKGDAVQAEGRMSYAILKVHMAEEELKDSMYYFQQRALLYYTTCEIIDPRTYLQEHSQEIAEMKQYQKKQIPWAYVRTTDIAECGKKLCLKTLENATGTIITVSEDTYVMIGCRGEVYSIAQTTFDRSYQKSEEQLDIWEQMLDFIPAIETIPDGQYRSIDELAHLCYPISGNGIYAKKLDKRTKVYLSEKQQEYFLGKPGDYLAIRCDNTNDIYIIQGDIFYNTYEEAFS